MQFNHVSNRIYSDAFETIIEMFVGQLKFVELRRIDRAIWLRQIGSNVDLQLSRSDSRHRDLDKKWSQISFLSRTPEADLRELADWLNAKGLDARVEAYSDLEFYLDAPTAFVDFVIEAMKPELAIYGSN